MTKINIPAPSWINGLSCCASVCRQGMYLLMRIAGRRLGCGRTELHQPRLTIEAFLLSCFPAFRAGFFFLFLPLFLFLFFFFFSKSYFVSAFFLAILLFWTCLLGSLRGITTEHVSIELAILKAAHSHSRCFFSSDIFPCQVHPALLPMHLTKIFSYTLRAIRFMLASSVSSVRSYGQEVSPDTRASSSFSLTHARL